MAADKLTNNLVADMLGKPGRSDSHTILSAALNGDCGVALATFEPLITVVASLKR